MIIEREIDMARNWFGFPLTEDCRTRLMTVLETPNRDTWDDAFSIILNGEVGLGLTVWQAVIALDPSYSDIGRVTDFEGNIISDWKRIPDRELLRQAVAYATH